MANPFTRLCLMVLISALLTVTTAVAGPSCTCRYAGQSFQVNSCVCITTAAARPQVACCGMVVNNTSWTFTKKACPMAALETVRDIPIKFAQSTAIAFSGKQTQGNTFK